MSCNIHRTINNPCPVCKVEEVRKKAEQPEVKEHWDFWHGVIESQIGKSMMRSALMGLSPAQELMLDQIKLELSDFSQLMSAASEVYCELTGGHISKPLTVPSAVIGEASEHSDEIMRDYVKEWLDDVLPHEDIVGPNILAQIRESAAKHFNFPNEEDQ